MKRLLTTIIALSLLAIPSAAAPDGLPLPVDSSPSGVEDASGKWRFMAIPRQGRTAVMVQQVTSGSLIQSNLLRGHFVVPAVAYDGSAGGLSANNHRLVLIQPRTRFPRPDTTFAVLDGRGLAVDRILRLRGDFSFDALSPDGRLLYLIQYLSRRDPTQYQVRVYDLRKRRLVPEPIVDPREEPGEMYGLPITRAVSPDGRWAYTLYDGQEHPFIHALDTSGRRAVCIDLDALHAPRGLYNLRLDVAPDGDTLSVVGKRGPLANVDVGSWRVSNPAARHPRGDEGGTPWLFVGGLAALLALAGGIAASRRGRRGGAAPRGSMGAPASWSDDQGSEALRHPVGQGNGAEPDRARKSGSSARS